MTTTERPDHGQDGQASETPDPATPKRAPASGWAKTLGAENLSLADTLGGSRGLLDMGLPGVLFVAVYTVTRNLTASVWTAVALAGALTALRLVRRESLQQAVGGFLGVALCAFIAAKSGRAENYYVPGFFINIAYGTAALVSVLVRWPLIGVLVGPVLGEGLAWRRDPARMRAYTMCTWLWVGLFAVRLLVQLPLYFGQHVIALGIARAAMGFPLFGLVIYVNWLILHRVPKAQPAP
ncbi:hypothetical protein LI90_2586 [Carbonactinospora thermoautotrophica]|uniref:DUF3159 domain-containing protein n=1 Tax=Carbonactinospora thermoautotrophica TaxID=1469144 RepID=A0A132MUS7_9ACTN|nr:DUF3159 domain-containing protein [Carbonactinospora thermoautotrophica]KWX01554.1 hypothetical protein LI90_2586 [Carbonactinospora thermoautotrophica]